MTINHPWNVTPKEAIAIQDTLRNEVKLCKLDKEIKYIAGADVSFNKHEKDIYAGIIVLTFPDSKIIEQSLVKDIMEFPYIPGLLSFREIPALMKAYNKLKNMPDVVIVDGQGIAHPRRLGIASHFGILADVPTIGCAKSLLFGTYEDVPNELGSFSYIKNRNDEKEIIGTAYRSKKNSKPLIISPGHKITLEESIEMVSKSITKYRLPEPTRLAHELVNKFRRGEIKT
jgi:deoxyribonuclease V